MISCNEMGILNIDTNDTNYNEDAPETIIHIRLLTWHVRFKKRKALKKSLNEELMIIAWHPRTWRNFCVSEDEKKDIEPIFTE